MGATRQYFRYSDTTSKNMSDHDTKKSPFVFCSCVVSLSRAQIQVRRRKWRKEKKKGASTLV
jgi:hypothetical protein